YVSSVLWYAFYGENGMPILQEFFEREQREWNTAYMEHDGRFKLPNYKTDFVIISFPKKTVVYEKPRIDKATPYRFREKLTYLPVFNSIESRIDLRVEYLDNILNLDKILMESVKREIQNRDEEKDSKN